MKIEEAISKSPLEYCDSPKHHMRGEQMSTYRPRLCNIIAIVLVCFQNKETFALTPCIKVTVCVTDISRKMKFWSHTYAGQL